MSKFGTYVKGYFSRHFGVMLVFLLSFILQFSFLLVKEVRIGDLLYFLILEVFVGGIVVIVYFIKYCFRVMELERLLQQDVAHQNIVEEMEDCIDNCLIKIIQQQHKSRNDEINRQKRRQNQMKEYYNMWVHQIKTPIAAMNVMLQSLKKELENNDLTLDNAYIVKEVEELQSQLFLVEQYTDMALQYQRLQTEGSDFKLEEISLDKIMREAIRKYAKLFINKKLSVKYEPSNNKVLSDEKWLGFVIGQLLNNAIKYSRTGTIFICIKEKDSYIQLCIKDEGIGISEEDLPRIFERGYTGYNGRVDKSSTGIGLFLCKEVLIKLGHRIVIESKLGVGTTVYLEFSKKRLCVE